MTTTATVCRDSVMRAAAMRWIRQQLDMTLPADGDELHEMVEDDVQRGRLLYAIERLAGDALALQLLGVREPAHVQGSAIAVSSSRRRDRCGEVVLAAGLALHDSGGTMPDPMRQNQSGPFVIPEGAGAALEAAFRLPHDRAHPQAMQTRATWGAKDGPGRITYAIVYYDTWTVDPRTLSFDLATAYGVVLSEARRQMLPEWGSEAADAILGRFVRTVGCAVRTTIVPTVG